MEDRAVKVAFIITKDEIFPSIWEEELAKKNYFAISFKSFRGATKFYKRWMPDVIVVDLLDVSLVGMAGLRRWKGQIRGSQWLFIVNHPKVYGIGGKGYESFFVGVDVMIDDIREVAPAKVFHS